MSPHSHSARLFVVVSTRTGNLCLSWARRIIIPRPFILFCKIPLNIVNHSIQNLRIVSFPQEYLCAVLFTPLPTCHLLHLFIVMLFIMKLSLAIHYVSLFGRKTLKGTIFWKAPILRFPQHKRPSLSHSYKEQAKLFALCVSVLMILDNKSEIKSMLDRNAGRIPKICSVFNFSLYAVLIFFNVVTKYLKFATFSKDLLNIFTLWFIPKFFWRDMKLHADSSTPSDCISEYR